MFNLKKTERFNATRGYGFLENFLARQRCSMADSLIPAQLRKGKILDIGCGTSPLFLNKTLFHEKYGLDKVRSIDNRAIHLINHDFEKIQTLPFKENSFNVITLLAVIEHIQPQNVFSILCETRRILKPNGIIILTTPAAWTDRLLRTMAKFKIVSAVEIEDHKDTYTKNKLKNMIAASGYAKNNVRSGYFECFANIWIMAQKYE
jgi:2-polyprenyl-3-methyl-5-hydroxy-6-metoxy-1,4-benzoquinol methylase